MVNIRSTYTVNMTRKSKVKVFPHPVDSGWSWVTLIGAFVSYIIVGGILRTFGIFMVEFLDDYDTDSATSSLIIGLQFASSGVIGFFGMTVGIKYVTPRQLIMTGGFISGLGLIINISAKSIYFFLFSHSLLVGAAIGAINGPCLYELGLYFDKKRSLANGVAMGGVSFGGLIMSPFARFLIDTYALKGAFLILGAIQFHIIPAGALLRPQSFYKITRKRKPKISDNSSNKYNTKHISKTHSKEMFNEKKGDSTHDIRIETGRKRSYSNRLELSMPTKYRNEISINVFSSEDQEKQNKSKDSIRPDNVSSVKSRKISDPTPPRSRKISDHRKPEAVALLEENNEQVDGFRPRSSTSDSFSPLARKAMLQRMRSRTESEVLHVEPIDAGLLEKGGVFQSNNVGSTSDNQRRQFYVSNEFLYDISTPESIRSISEQAIYTKSKNEKKKIFFILKRFCNFELFRSPSFTLFLTGYIIGSIGSFYPIVFIPPLGDSYGIDKTNVSIIMSITSAVDVVGRSASGFLADRRPLGLERKNIIIMALTICGILNFLNSFYDQFWSLTLYAVIYGVIGGTMFAINTSTLSEVVEPDTFGQAVGFLVGSQQFTLGVGGPVAGAFRDLTGTYSATFYFLGCCNFVAVFLFLTLISYIKCRKTERTK